MECISPIYVRKARQHVPCGKCNYCLQTKRNDWSFRLAQELKISKTAYFLTLTYDDSNVPLSPSGELQLQKLDMVRFQKRVRKQNKKLAPDWQFRYYSVGEYGTQTERPHYHSISFNIHPDLDIVSAWPYGNIQIGDVNPASIHYVTKYVVNRIRPYGGREPPFAIMSRKPGLGTNYLKTHMRWQKAQRKNYTKVNGQTARLPRFYKDKVFNRVDKDLINYEIDQLRNHSYWEEVERLSAFHDNPQNYYYERITHTHDSITQKINKKNLF